MNKINSDVYDWLSTAGQKPDKSKLKLASKLVSEEICELEDGCVTDNRTEVLDGLIDSFWVLLNVAFFYGITLEELESYQDKVSLSNWSKFCKSEQEAVDTCRAYTNGTHPDKPGLKIDCDYEKSGDWWVIKRSDGKILKSLNYVNVSNI